MKRNTVPETMTKPNEQTAAGRVKQICQKFSLNADSGLAHRLQQEEFAVHFDRNRTHRRASRLGMMAARDVEEEERQAFVAKQMDFYERKRKIEQNDIKVAQQLQGETRIPTTSVDQVMNGARHRSSSDRNSYEEIEHSSAPIDTSNDEQLARILQEEEDSLSSTIDSARLHRRKFT